jgi:hypothetical protein
MDHTREKGVGVVAPVTLPPFAEGCQVWLCSGLCRGFMAGWALCRPFGGVGHDLACAMRTIGDLPEGNSNRRSLTLPWQ